MLIRNLALALLVANALFFAWARGWLAPLSAGPAHSQREPARQDAQVRPELIKVLTPRAASEAAARAASAAAAGTCLETTPLTPTEADAAEAALEQAGIPRSTWQRRNAPGTPDRAQLVVEAPAEPLQQQLQALPGAAPRFSPCASPR